MAYLDIRKDGKLVSRRLVSDSAAEKGIRWKLGQAEYQMTLGETAKVGDYELVLLAGTPPARKKPPPVASQDKPATKTGTFAAINPQMMDDGDVLDLAGDPNVPKVDGYEIKGRIGGGGMGTVWRAMQLSTKREVALKFLQERKLHSTKAQIRFEREVQLCARLEHPNIARIYDSGLSKGVYYYALELIRGEAMDDYASMMGLNQKQILELMVKACGAVQYAHAHGVIHRDLKPSNILVSDDGQPHVLDFGLAKSLMEDENDLTISKEGDVAGTPAFMAPEQAAGHASEITAKTDVYALGIILYKLLLKHHPHDLTGPHYEVIRRIVEDEVRNPRDIDKRFNPELSAILLKSLAHNPEDRYVTAGEMGKDITSFLSGEPLIAQELTATYMLRRKFRKHRGKILMLAGAAAAFIAGIMITAISLSGPSDKTAIAPQGPDSVQPQPQTVAIVKPPAVTTPPATQPSIAKTPTPPTQPVEENTSNTQTVAMNTAVDWKKLTFEKGIESSRTPEPQLMISETPAKVSPAAQTQPVDNNPPFALTQPSVSDPAPPLVNAADKEVVALIDPNKGFQNTGVNLKERHFYSITVQGFWSAGQGASQREEFGPEGPLPSGVRPDVLVQPPKDSLEGRIGDGKGEPGAKYRISILRETKFMAPASGTLFLGRINQETKLSGLLKVKISEIPNPWTGTDTFSIRARVNKLAYFHVKQDGVFWEYTVNAQAGQKDNDENFPTLINNVMWWPVRQANQNASDMMKELKMLPEKGKLLAIMQSSSLGSDNLVVTAKLDQGCVRPDKVDPDEVILQFEDQHNSRWLEGVFKTLPAGYVPPTTQGANQPSEQNPQNPGLFRPPPVGPDGKPLPYVPPGQRPNHPQPSQRK